MIDAAVREYLFQGFQIVGIPGEQGSPACGVTRTRHDNRHQDGQGMWLRELKKRLVAGKLDIAIFAVVDHERDKAINWLAERLR